MKQEADDVLTFWFSECAPEDWFTKSDDFDKQLENRFGELVECALLAQLDGWNAQPESRLALIILLDQFTRNIYRDTPRAFAGDEMALGICLGAIAEGQLEREDEMAKRQFLLMPMMHSEALEIQEKSLALFKKYTSERTYDYAVRHRDIVARFGHFPHRNAILGRPSTAEEIAFLTEPNSSF